VVSENSKTFKTKVKYENAIDDGIKTLITAIQAIGPQYGLTDTEGAINIQWNDNVIEDRDAKTDYWIKRYEAGTCTLTDVLVHVDGMEPEEAADRAAKIKAESATVDVGAMFGGNDGAE
jgi:A118 family predicted phage portal protein